MKVSQFASAIGAAALFFGAATNLVTHSNKEAPLLREVTSNAPKPCAALSNNMNIVTAWERARTPHYMAPQTIYCTRNGGKVKLKLSTYMSEYAMK